MNSAYQPIVITASDVPALQQSTYTVSIYSYRAGVYIDIYTGRCVGDGAMVAVIRIDSILRDYAYRCGRDWMQTVQEYMPDNLHSFADMLFPVEDGTAFIATTAAVTVVNNGVERYRVQDIPVWAGWLAPWQKGTLPFHAGVTCDLALVGNKYVPHLPPVVTSRLWLSLSLLWLDENGVQPELGIGVTRATLQTNGAGCYSVAYTLQELYETLANDNMVDGGESDSAPDDMIDGGDSDDIPDDTLDGGDSSGAELIIAGADIMLYGGAEDIKVAEIDTCASPFYLAWYLPSGGWMCRGFDGNITYGGSPDATLIKDLAGADNIIQVDAQPTANLYSGIVTKDEYNLLTTLNYTREVYLYDVANDNGIWCSVENRGVQTAGSQRWRNQPYEVTLKQLKRTVI